MQVQATATVIDGPGEILNDAGRARVGSRLCAYALLGAGLVLVALALLMLSSGSAHADEGAAPKADQSEQQSQPQTAAKDKQAKQDDGGPAKTEQTDKDFPAQRSTNEGPGSDARGSDEPEKTAQPETLSFASSRPATADSDTATSTSSDDAAPSTDSAPQAQAQTDDVHAEPVEPATGHAEDAAESTHEAVQHTAKAADATVDATLDDADETVAATTTTAQHVTEDVYGTVRALPVAGTSPLVDHTVTGLEQTTDHVLVGVVAGTTHHATGVVKDTVDAATAPVTGEEPAPGGSTPPGSPGQPGQPGQPGSPTQAGIPTVSITLPMHPVTPGGHGLDETGSTHTPAAHDASGKAAAFTAQLDDFLASIAPATTAPETATAAPADGDVPADQSALGGAVGVTGTGPVGSAGGSGPGSAATALLQPFDISGGSTGSTFGSDTWRLPTSPTSSPGHSPD